MLTTRVQEKMEVRKLSKLPGFIWVEQAIRSGNKKIACLKKMQELNVDAIPVDNKNRDVEGVLERPELITSIIIDVSTER